MIIKKNNKSCLKNILFFTDAGKNFTQNKQTIIETGVEAISIFGSEVSLVKHKARETRENFTTRFWKIPK